MAIQLGDGAEITGREIIVNIIAVLILLIIAFMIASKVAEYQDDYNVKFYHAIQVNDSTQFNYALKTNAGDMLAYGTVNSVGFVSDSGIGNYMTLTRALEEYRKHHRTVCSGSGKDRHCHTQTYWSWDEIKRNHFSVAQVEFLGKRFYYSQFPELPGEHYISTIELKRGFLSHRQRYVYYGRKLSYTGTMYTYADKHTINNSLFADGVQLKDAIKYYIKEYCVAIFWIVFAIVVIIGSIVFVVAENEWLNGSR